MNDTLHENVEVSTSHSAKEPDFMDPHATMLVLTWVVFFSLVVVLHKFAWKPILAALEKREEDIRKAVEYADKIKEELANIHEQQKQILTEATLKARDIVDQSRKAAVEAAHSIQHKAKKESEIILENAQRQIKEELERAKSQLRETAADIAITVASKLIEKNLDDEKNRELTNQLIKEI